MADVREKILEKLKEAGLSEAAIATFLRNFERLRSGEKGWIPESTIEPVEELPQLEELPEPKAPATQYYRKLVIIKLNGGLGTSMGLEQPKSLILVRDGYTFLDLIVNQILLARKQSGGRYPAFYLMNSFRTRTKSLRWLTSRYPYLGAPDELDFVQNWVPKLRVDTLEPVQWPKNPELEWCPPGHGDFYPAIYGCGLLDELLSHGVEYAFVSNSDNLGAVIDLRILQAMESQGIEFLMEVARRTPMDRKGGHIAIRKQTGRFVLRECTQCPEADRSFFEDIQRHRYFNTNNLWIHLESLRDLLKREEGALPLPLIVNEKNVDPTDPDSPRVYQLETAIGAAIELFERAQAVEVPRSRFAPVKTTSDLLAVRSDAYVLTEDYRLILSPLRNGQPVIVQLDSKYYKILAQFERFFSEGTPSLVHCDQLRVKGPIRFHRAVICEGEKVEFYNPTDQVRALMPGVYTTGRHEAIWPARDL